MLVGVAGLQAQEFIVSSLFTDNVLRYESDGAYSGVFAQGGGMESPNGIVFGPDGHLYVSNTHSPTVRRYHRETGRYLGKFVRDRPGTAVDESGGLGDPAGIVFGPDDNLYVSSSTTDQVLRFDGRSGVFIDVFAESEELTPVTLAFGPDGDLYVTSGLAATDQVKVFDGRSGVLLRTLSNETLTGPTGLAFDHRGNLLVASAGGNSIGRFDVATGNLRGIVVSDANLDRPLGLTIRPDRKRHLFVVSFGGNSVRRYHSSSGRLIDEPVPAGSGGLSGGHYLLFRPREADCGLVDSMNVTCSGSGRLKAKLISTLPTGTLLTLENNSLTWRLKVKKSGKAIAIFRRQGGAHRLSLLECPAVRETVECG